MINRYGSKTLTKINGGNMSANLTAAAKLLLAIILSLVIIAASPQSVRSQSDEIIPFVIEIGKSNSAFLGENVTIPVIKKYGSQPILGFDFLIGFDNAGVFFNYVTPGILFDKPGDYEWEYFTYRYVANDDCGWYCPTGLVGIVALADQNDGDNHPLETSVPDGTILFELNFDVTSHPTYEGLFVPIRFYWRDCTDNAISYEDSESTQLALSQSVYDYDSTNITDSSAGFPTYYGASGECFEDPDVPERLIDFYNSGIQINSTDFLTAHWGDTIEFDVPAIDPDPENSCDDLYFTMTQGPATAELDTLTGHFVWPTTGDDVCYSTAIFEISDGCGAMSEYAVNICIQNDAPLVTNDPNDTIYVGWEHQAFGQVEAFDPDDGPNNLSYRVYSFNGPTWFDGGVQIDPETGAWSWRVIEDAEYLGDFQLIIEVSDDAETCDGCSPDNSDLAVFNIHVFGQTISIEAVHDQLQGHYANVSIFLDSTYIPDTLIHDFIGGFDFMIAYDAAILTPLGAEPGSLIDDGKFEYFTYRFGPFGNCPDCPAGLLKVIAMRDENDGVVNDYHLTSPGELVILNFLVSSDSQYDCVFTPVRFYWIDCGDNTISDESGNWLYMGSNIYDWDYNSLNNPDSNFGIYGPNPDCYDSLYSPDETYKNAPIGSIIYRNGGIDIHCSQVIDDRGDVNLNGIRYELADFVVFMNFFLYGPSAFNINYEGQKAATDINGDGITLTIQDLTYLLRILDGNLLPIPESYKGPYDSFDGTLYISETDTSIIISSDFADSVGILYIVFEADGVQSDSDCVINVDPGIAHLNVGHTCQGNRINILIWQFATEPPENDSAVIHPGFKKLLEIQHPGETSLFVAAEAAGFLAERVNLTIYGLPAGSPTFEPYPSAMTNDYYGGFEYQFTALYSDKSSSPIRYSLLSGPGEIDPITGLWKYAPVCVDVGTTCTLEICASDPIHPCETGDTTQIATVELSVVNEVPSVGDADGDGEVVFEDIIRIIAYKYLNGDEPVPSYLVADVNADGTVNLFDIVYLIWYLYLNGPAPLCPPAPL